MRTTHLLGKIFEIDHENPEFLRMGIWTLLSGTLWDPDDLADSQIHF
jgi:hypothetical protein